MRLVGTEGLYDIPECLARARDLTVAESVARRATGCLPDVFLDGLNADDAIAGARSRRRHEAGAGDEKRSEAIRISLLIDEDGIRAPYSAVMIASTEATSLGRAATVAAVALGFDCAVACTHGDTLKLTRRARVMCFMMPRNVGRCARRVLSRYPRPQVAPEYFY